MSNTNLLKDIDKAKAHLASLQTEESKLKKRIKAQQARIMFLQNRAIKGEGLKWVMAS